MKHCCLLMLSAGLFAGNALAGNGEDLARKANCLTCHAVDQKSLGPSFKDISARYRSDKAVAGALERKVRHGGAGAWGKMPMPATANSIGDDDIKGIVQWILSLR